MFFVVEILWFNVEALYSAYKIDDINLNDQW